MLDRVAKKLGEQDRLVVVIDALDEWDSTTAPVAANPLFLPNVLPDKVFVVITTKEPLDSLRLNVAVSPGHLELKHDSEGNIADARLFAESQLNEPAIREWLAR